MKTILYNTIDSTVIGDVREGYYLVDGVRPTLPDNFIELELEDVPQPEAQDGFVLTYSREVDLESKKYKLVWTYAPMPPKAREEYLRDLDIKYQEQLDAGIEINGVRLKCEEPDRAIFAQLISLLNEAERFNMLPETTTINLFDGSLLTLPTIEARQLITLMGFEYQKIWLERFRLQNLILSSPLEDLEDLEIVF